MNISYGIPLTPGYDEKQVQALVDSIDLQGKQIFHDYEIILCGEYRNDIRSSHEPVVIPFDETMKPKWITAKKNRIIEKARYDTLCLLHDYYLLGPEWYSGLLDFTMLINPRWKVLLNKITTFEGTRHSDWLVNPSYMDEVIRRYPHLDQQLRDYGPHERNGARFVNGLPYGEQGLRHIQYNSGGYILAKTDVFRETPFDERYAWGEAAEDLIWSEGVINKGHRFDFNPFSSCTLQKPGKWHLCEMTPECIRRLKEVFGEDL